MNELLNGIFECLDINSSTGLATEDSLQSLTPFQRLFYTQVHEKIGIDAVYFLRDANGIAKVPLIYFSVIHKYDAKQVAENCQKLTIIVVISAVSGEPKKLILPIIPKECRIPFITPISGSNSHLLSIAAPTTGVSQGISKSPIAIPFPKNSLFRRIAIKSGTMVFKTITPTTHIIEFLKAMKKCSS